VDAGVGSDEEMGVEGWLASTSCCRWVSRMAREWALRGRHGQIPQQLSCSAPAPGGYCPRRRVQALHQLVMLNFVGVVCVALSAKVESKARVCSDFYSHYEGILTKVGQCIMLSFEPSRHLGTGIHGNANLDAQ